MSAASERDVIDRSDRVFCSPRHVHFVEMEYGIPFDAVPDAIGRIVDLTSRLPFPPMFPIEVRSSKGDDIPLSTANGRDSGWIAVHQYVGVPYEAYFQGVEQIMNDYAGRPHWGKMHFQSRHTLAHRYPEWDTFQSLAAQARSRRDVPQRLPRSRARRTLNAYGHGLPASDAGTGSTSVRPRLRRRESTSGDVDGPRLVGSFGAAAPHDADTTVGKVHHRTRNRRVDGGGDPRGPGVRRRCRGRCRW